MYMSYYLKANFHLQDNNNANQQGKIENNVEVGHTEAAGTQPGS